jgi:hypothetical protein
VELTTPELRTHAERVDDMFEYTEFAPRWREPLPRARFGSERFMWGCLALTVVVMAWIAVR